MTSYYLYAEPWEIIFSKVGRFRRDMKMDVVDHVGFDTFNENHEHFENLLAPVVDSMFFFGDTGGSAVEEDYEAD